MLADLPCLSVLSMLLFAVLDIYYLQLERRFRCTYELVRTGKLPANFTVTPYGDKEKANARIWDCIKSPSIWLFYPGMMGIIAAIAVLRWKGVM